jgi:hypothetical protein
MTWRRNDLITLIRELGSGLANQNLAAINRMALCQHIQDIFEERGLLVDTTDDPVLPNPYTNDSKSHQSLASSKVIQN